MCRNEDLLKKITENKVLVIGDIMVDRSVYGLIDRLSSEAPINIFDKIGEKNELGGAANVAKNLIAMGQSVTLLGVVGKDEVGSLVLELLKKEGLDESLIVIDENRKTTLKTRFFTKEHLQVFRTDEEDVFEISKEIEDLLFDKIDANIAYFDGIIFSDYLKGVLSYSLVERIIALARKNKVITFADPKSSDYSKYKNCNVLKPNRKEFAKMLAIEDNFDKREVFERGFELLSQNGNDCLVVTLGKEGMAAVDGENNRYSVPAMEIKAVDVCGAGDTAISYLAGALLSGIDLENSLKAANAAAGKKVQNKGTYSVKKDEVFKSRTKIIDKTDLERVRKTYENEKIVFTNGCFDLIHAGHIDCLKEAARLGDILVVGINSDASVNRLKGGNRPIIDLKNRMAVLEALSFVDYVVAFEEDTPLEVVKLLKPNVLVKGADYRDKEVVGREVVEGLGGKVEFIALKEGLSTSLIVKKIYGEK